MFGDSAAEERMRLTCFARKFDATQLMGEQRKPKQETKKKYGFKLRE